MPSEETSEETSSSSSDTLPRAGLIDPRTKQYWLWTAPIVFGVTIVLIPLIPVYLIVANWVFDRWLERFECVLNERTLVIRKGILNRVESTIPLGKITDLQLYQGPLMRLFGLQGFRVETAGQSSGPGAHLVNVIGIVDTEGFRSAVLAQRDRLEDGGHTAAPQDDALLVLGERILASLERIEARLPAPSEGEH